MNVGLIIKSLSGFYDVLFEGKIYSCRGRGLLRKQKIIPVVGDNVQFIVNDGNDNGIILKVEERSNYLIRPPIANVNQVLLVFSVLEPEFNLVLLDRFLVCIEKERMKPLICLTKADLLSNEKMAEIKKSCHLYESIGYKVILLSIKEKDSIRELEKSIRGKISVLAGQSGVGKSSLLNALDSKLKLETGAISKHLGRGKHTTRHVEFIRYEDGFIADTPGFGSLEIGSMDEKKLEICFPELHSGASGCKFRGCLHVNEPNCNIRKRVKSEKIARHRYEHYLKFLEEIRGNRRRY